MIPVSAHLSVRPPALLYLTVQSGHFKILPRTSHVSAPVEGSVANRVCGFGRISEALRYKAAVMERLGRTILWGDFCQCIRLLASSHWQRRVVAAVLLLVLERRRTFLNLSVTDGQKVTALLFLINLKVLLNSNADIYIWLLVNVYCINIVGEDVFTNLVDFKSLHNLTKHSLLSGTSQFFQAISSSFPSPTSMALAYSSADCHFHIFIAPVTKPHCDRHRSTKLCPQGKHVCFLMRLFILLISAKKKRKCFSPSGRWSCGLWL